MSEPPRPTLPSPSLASSIRPSVRPSSTHGDVQTDSTLALFCLFVTREHLGKYNTNFTRRNIDYTLTPRLATRSFFFYPSFFESFVVFDFFGQTCREGLALVFQKRRGAKAVKTAAGRGPAGIKGQRAPEAPPPSIVTTVHKLQKGFEC